MKTAQQRKAYQREKHIQGHMGRCVHFTGVQHDTCKAGVNYHGLLGNGIGCFAHLPCLADDGATVTCDRRVFPTREEAEAEENDHEQHLKRALAAIKAAHDDAKAKGLGKDHGGSDSVKCPNCDGGMLRYAVASYNGHMHAACTTPNCISWME